MKMRRNQLTGVLAGAAITPFAAAAAIASAGAGHGSYSLARLLFPYSMLLTRFANDTISHPSIGLALVQFPLYGFVATTFDATRAAVCLSLSHIICVCLCFSGLLPNFS